ncbi:MAG: Rrf2 family transcriptional regulator [Halarsenatibacteraceae bacterium]
MKTSRKTDYGIHALMILAKKDGEELSVNDLAEIENVSASYLAKVMQELSNNNIVSSSEGKQGGYLLNLPPEKITLAQITEIFESDSGVFDCVDDLHGCSIRDRCKIHAVFREAYQKMLIELENTTIADILDPEIKDVGK